MWQTNCHKQSPNPSTPPRGSAIEKLQPHMNTLPVFRKILQGVQQGLFLMASNGGGHGPCYTWKWNGVHNEMVSENPALNDAKEQQFRHPCVQGASGSWKGETLGFGG